MPVWQLLPKPQLTLLQEQGEKSERRKKDCSFFSFGAILDVICYLGDCAQPPKPLDC